MAEAPSTLADRPSTAPPSTDRPSTAPPEHLNVVVQSQNGEAVHFKLKPTTPLSKLMTAYCDRQGLAEAGVRFLFDGSRLKPDDTAKSLGIEEGDSIDVMVEQTGGYFV